MNTAHQGRNMKKKKKMNSYVVFLGPKEFIDYHRPKFLVEQL